jgi:hypothetical protein
MARKTNSPLDLPHTDLLLTPAPRSIEAGVGFPGARRASGGLGAFKAPSSAIQEFQNAERDPGGIQTVLAVESGRIA